jgi:hypothetical protein
MFTAHLKFAPNLSQITEVLDIRITDMACSIVITLCNVVHTISSSVLCSLLSSLVGCLIRFASQFMIFIQLSIYGLKLLWVSIAENLNFLTAFTESLPY